MTDEGDWVVKVRRNGGGYSVIDIASKEDCQKVVDEFNAKYQTDTYYAEPYQSKDAYGAHSHHR